MALNYKHLSLMYVLVLFLSSGLQITKGRRVVLFPFECTGTPCANLWDCNKWCKIESFLLGGECVDLGDDTGPECCCRKHPS
ncbi:hypothetical protein RND81_04G099400 [Saponaria officinalis]|uniref:Uncharacterized protein n=1 Tax=Saponaria officinalis TaxID=3572 RepID=A0AAW1LLF9_SAPOF